MFREHCLNLFKTAYIVNNKIYFFNKVETFFSVQDLIPGDNLDVEVRSTVSLCFCFMLLLLLLLL